MLIERRQFLGGALALGAVGAVADAHPAVEEGSPLDFNVFGSPPRLPLEDGFHPVAPERVIVVDNYQAKQYAVHHQGFKRHLRKLETGWWAARRNHSPPQTKLDLILGIIEQVTAHYRRADLFRDWARAHFHREYLGSTGAWGGLGTIQDFQDFDREVATDNYLVDWWLVMFPGGVDWQAGDGRPTYLLVGPVMARRRVGPYLKVMEAMSQAVSTLLISEGGDASGWASDIANLNPDEAARRVSQAILRRIRKV